MAELSAAIAVDREQRATTPEAWVTRLRAIYTDLDQIPEMADRLAPLLQLADDMAEVAQPILVMPAPERDRRDVVLMIQEAAAAIAVDREHGATIQRFDLEPYGGYYQCYEMKAREDGEWVRFADVCEQAATSNLYAAYVRLAQAILPGASADHIEIMSPSCIVDAVIHLRRALGGLVMACHRSAIQYPDFREVLATAEAALNEGAES